MTPTEKAALLLHTRRVEMYAGKVESLAGDLRKAVDLLDEEFRAMEEDVQKIVISLLHMGTKLSNSETYTKRFIGSQYVELAQHIDQAYELDKKIGETPDAKD